MRKFFAAFVALGFLISASSPANAQLTPESARELANRDTVGIIAGSVRGTYIRFAQDMADAIDEPGHLRVIAMLGRGSVQNIADLLWLKGVDVAIVQSDVFESFERAKLPGGSDYKDKIHYIMKLYNEEIHILARRNILNIRDLANLKVSTGTKKSGTNATSFALFKALEIPIERVNLPNSEAVAAVRDGSIAAAMFVAGKPASYFSDITPKEDVHLLKVEIDKELEARGYLSSEFLPSDYPNLVLPGEAVETVAVGAVLAVYNWKTTSSRYIRTVRFSESLLKNLGRFRTSGAFHPKWKQVDPRVKVPSWTRFEPMRVILKE